MKKGSWFEGLLNGLGMGMVVGFKRTLELKWKYVQGRMREIWNEVLC
jgi:hypothetical protein